MVQIKRLLEFIVNFYAKLTKFSFPSKFTWRWKSEMLFGWYEKETVKVFKNIIKPEMTIIDIGAHIGYYTRLFSKLVGKKGRVFAFEADPVNFDFLKKNTKHLNNVVLINKAISDQNGNIDFYHVANSTGCHSVIKPNKPAEKITVQATTLDSVMKEHNLIKIDVIKMDIEGGELLALIGMQNLLTNNSRMKIITEYNPLALDKLESCDFKLLKIPNSINILAEK
ncbi:MAG: FkbM family methyltransferase [Patescibacteria group bacterium]|nr:FkbM family methyltransferase [Patescibacteria group bacterium]